MDKEEFLRLYTIAAATRETSHTSVFSGERYVKEALKAWEEIQGIIIKDKALADYAAKRKEDENSQ